MISLLLVFYKHMRVKKTFTAFSLRLRVNLFGCSRGRKDAGRSRGVARKGERKAQRTHSRVFSATPRESLWLLAGTQRRGALAGGSSQRGKKGAENTFPRFLCDSARISQVSRGDAEAQGPHRPECSTPAKGVSNTSQLGCCRSLGETTGSISRQGMARAGSSQARPPSLARW